MLHKSQNYFLLAQTGRALAVVALVQILVTNTVLSMWTNTADVGQNTWIRSLVSLFNFFFLFIYSLFPISSLQYFHFLMLFFIHAWHPQWLLWIVGLLALHCESISQNVNELAECTSKNRKCWYINHPKCSWMWRSEWKIHVMWRKFETLYIKTTYYSLLLGVFSGLELKCNQRNRPAV